MASRSQRALRRARQWGLLGMAIWACGCLTLPAWEEEPLVSGNRDFAESYYHHLTTRTASPYYRPFPSRQEVPGPMATAKAPGTAVRQVGHQEETPAPETLPAVATPAGNRFPINLPTSLRLAGASNLQIALASERIREADARLKQARVRWLPSLNAGVIANMHDGQLQDTRGDVLDVQRDAVFVGGGPNLGGAPLTGASNGPARLFVGLPLADLLFGPLAERQEVRAAGASHAAVFNDTLLEVAEAYLTLVAAQGEAVITDEAVEKADNLVRLVRANVKAGRALEADALRAEADRAERRRQREQAEERVQVASAELVRLLRLDPTITLFPLEGQPAPIEVIHSHLPLPELIAQAITSRPELAADRARVRAMAERVRQERWRPLLPTLQVGVSGGGFGGGPDGTFGNFDGRVDFDALAVWELRNLGFGNRSLREERGSQHRQARLGWEQTRDRVAAEVSQGYYRVQMRQRQLGPAQEQVEAAAKALPLNFRGIQGGALRAIEAQQAIQALASARTRYLTAIVEYNQAQFQLLRALGQPLDAPWCPPETHPAAEGTATPTLPAPQDPPAHVLRPVPAVSTTEPREAKAGLEW